MKKIFLFVLLALIVLGILIFLLLFWHAGITNPYSKNTIMKPAYSATVGKDNQIVLRQMHSVRVAEDPLSICIVKAQATIRIISNGWAPAKPIHGNAAQIADSIHKERFDPSKAYLISGDHFADFYPRNYGMFYNAALDTSLKTNDQDWQNRQKVILQTTAMYLDILRQSKRTYAAYMPLNNSTMVGVEMWVYPSDSLYPVLYQLSALTDDQFIPGSSDNKYILQTKPAGYKLLKDYTPTLKRHIETYEKYVLDNKTHLVKKDIQLSGVRDGMIKRQSSFYDNVIAWGTAKLASDLGILHRPESELNDWKHRIITAFWDEKEGIFLDDLSSDAKSRHIFPGDGFVTTQTGFLNPKIPDDKEKLTRIIAYVKTHKLDDPFPLPWGIVKQPDRLALADRYLMKDYMGPSIFSHWGIEYIKAILQVSDDHPEYIVDAKKYLASYKTNIVKAGGYPEIYFTDGTIYHSPIYSIILHTGWIINFEQAERLLNNVSNPSST